MTAAPVRGRALVDLTIMKWYSASESDRTRVLCVGEAQAPACMRSINGVGPAGIEPAYLRVKSTALFLLSYGP